ncbi:MAG: efflux RND transporter periplasmic adaptor subunit [Bryobacterales bacterium]|nr:efflux RND transporter periplasmic adaptor subunit [Bryobacterales bacterium]
MRGMLAVALLLAACGRTPDPPAVAAKVEEPERPRNVVVLADAARRAARLEVAPASLKAAPEVLRAPGRIATNENRTWRVGAITEGRIVRVLASVGDFVKEGQVLARMHTHEIHEARAEYRKAIEEQNRSQAGVDFARRARDRAQRLYDLKAGSLQDVENAANALRTAETIAAHSGFEVERHRRHLEEYLGISADEPEHHGPGKHDDDHDLIPIRAPASGTVLSRGVTSGMVVTPSADLFVLSDLSRLWVMTQIQEIHLGRLRTGMPARVVVQAFGDRTFSATLERLGDQFDPETRTASARFAMRNPGLILKPEMYVTTEIELATRGEALFVPTTAIQELRGQRVVFVRTAQDTYEARAVEAGQILAGETEILRGVEAGEEIVISGGFILKSELLKASLEEE